MLRLAVIFITFFWFKKSLFCVVKIARLHQLVITHPASCWILWRCSHYWNTDWDKKIENVSPASIVVIVVSHWNVFIMSEPSKERIVEVCFIKHLLSLWIESYVGSSSEKRWSSYLDFIKFLTHRTPTPGEETRVCTSGSRLWQTIVKFEHLLISWRGFTLAGEWLWLDID